MGFTSIARLPLAISMRLPSLNLVVITDAACYAAIGEDDRGGGGVPLALGSRRVMLLA